MLILRPEIDSGSKFHLLLGDVHAAACGFQSKGLRALQCIPGFFDSLGRRLIPGRLLLSSVCFLCAKRILRPLLPAAAAFLSRGA